MKNGLSTINRLLGKHRESSGNLSRSSTNLSVTKSNVNIHDSSQEHHNRITPLPIATSNAPFEQTFRITVLLPRDQLYVARLGARVQLHKLLQLVCENKQLDPEKFEFQHPADPSQIFSCDLTIGAVGLSEIRLCSKSEYNTFRGDDVTSRRNSFSSSKLSRNSKTISNTPSLYSSRNSLNSMSSSGIDSNYRNIIPEVTPKYLAPVIPARKKRLAPRPPSQNLSLDNAAQTKISENSTNTARADSQPQINHNIKLDSPSNLENTLEQNDLIKSDLSVDCNGNTKGTLQNNGHCIEQCQEPSCEVLLKSQKLLSNSNDEAVPNDTNHSPSGIEITSSINQPEPSPRRRVQTLPKKTLPVAPPRSPKSPTEKLNEETQFDEKVHTDFTTTSTPRVSPVPFPRLASSNRSISQPLEQLEQLAVSSKNVTEIVINQSPTVESNSTVDTIEIKSAPEESISLQSEEPVQDGEDQIDRSWHSSSTQSSETKHKSFIESSSEDDEMIKVYDLKLGKTIVKTLSNHKTSEVIAVLPNNEPEQANKLNSVPEVNSVNSPIIADSSEKNTLNDITVAIEKDDSSEMNSSISEQHQVVNTVESPVSEPCASNKEENQNHSENEQIEKQRIIEETSNIDDIKSPLTPEFKEPQGKIIVEEIKEVKEVNNIDTIKPENLQQEVQLIQPQEIAVLSENQHSVEDPDETPKHESKVINDTITNCTQVIIKQEPLISTLERLGADEVELQKEEHLKATIPSKPAIQTKPAIQAKPALATRSSSFLSLVQLETKNQRNNTTDEYFSLRRRSSSELSIGESPSLQSLGVIKSILNSRNNSLCNSEESKTPPTECDIQSMEEPSPKSNILKTNKNKPGEEKIYRYSGPPNIHFSTWSERPKVQVSIKNEQDCIFDGSKVGQNTTSTVNTSKGDLALQKNNRNSVSVMEHEKVTLRQTSLSFASEKEVSKPQDSSPTSSTVPKFMLGGRTSHPRPVTIASSIGSGASAQNNRSSISQPLLRSTSITRIISNPVIKETPPAFGQSTLRKTGFKDKIVPLQDTDVDVSKPIPFTLKNQTNPQTTPKIIKNSFRADTTVPEAPPPPPIIRAVVTKQKTNRTQISLSVDPRDQLLSAIRNFKRDELKNANIL